MSEERITDPNKKKVEPVIDSSDVIVRKKSKGKKAVESFLGEEVESVKDHIVYDMIIPSTKDAMSNMCGGIVDFFNDMFHEFIDSIFFGSSEHTKTKASQTYVSYQGYYNKKSQSSGKPLSKRETYLSTRHDLEDLDFVDMETALKVRKELIELIENYNEASVADLFSLSDQTLDWAEYKEKDKFGWRDPSAIGKPRRRRGRYIIPLPRPEKLKED